MIGRIKLFIPLLVFALVASAFLVLEQRMGRGDYDPSNLPSALVGKPLPDFNLAQLENKDARVGAAQLRGAPALLNVWATWCIACRAEHGYLNELATAGVAIYGLNYKDERESALQWLERLGNPYRLVIFDVNGELGLDLGVYGAPETYVLDASGIIRYRHVGVMNATVWRDKIEPLGLDWNSNLLPGPQS